MEDQVYGLHEYKKRRPLDECFNHWRSFAYALDALARATDGGAVMTDDNNIFVMPVPKLGDGLPSPMTYEIATLRDQFAMAALHMLSLESRPDCAAKKAFAIADAMMEARK